MRVTVILIALCFSITVFSQDYKFGKVSKEELQEKFNSLDSFANATYLYKYRYTHFDYQQGEGFTLVTEVHERIKIYNKEGFDYATKSVSLYESNGGNKESLIGLKAYTYNLVEGKSEGVKLKKEGIFKNKVSKYYNETKFTMPNIKEGCVIEYKYQIRSPFYSMVDEFEFQHDIPIKKLVAKFETPEYFNFKLNTKGYLSVIPKKETKSDKITFNNKTRTDSEGTKFSTSDVNFISTIWNYDLKGIPALKDEPFVNNISNYRSSVKYELSYTKFPNSAIEYYSTTWEDVVKTIYKSSSFGGELNKTGYFEKDIDALIEGISDPMKRANLIYNFVKAQVKWNKYIGKYTNVGVKKAYKEHTGNVAEINLMLTAMLRYAGLNANPVLVSTRENGVPIFPTREGYNYVVTGIEVPNDVILMDATINSLPNILPFRVLNWNGRIIRKSGSSATVNLYPKKKSNVTTSLMVNLDAEGSIDGSLRISRTGHKALSYRSRNNGNDEEKTIEKIETKYNGIEVDEIDVKNRGELTKPIIETIKFTMDNQADIVNDKIYFSPLFFLKSLDNPFKLETREFPVDFGYPTSSISRIIVNLPEGYKVESLPKPTGGKLPEEQGSFLYRIVDNGSKVQVTFNININRAIISSLYYSSLKEYFNLLIEKENEQIVLTRI